MHTIPLGSLSLSLCLILCNQAFRLLLLTVNIQKTPLSISTFIDRIWHCCAMELIIMWLLCLSPSLFLFLLSLSPMCVCKFQEFVWFVLLIFIFIPSSAPCDMETIKKSLKERTVCVWSNKKTCIFMFWNHFTSRSLRMQNVNHQPHHRFLHSISNFQVEIISGT